MLTFTNHLFTHLDGCTLASSGAGAQQVDRLHNVGRSSVPVVAKTLSSASVLAGGGQTLAAGSGHTHTHTQVCPSTLRNQPQRQRKRGRRPSAPTTPPNPAAGLRLGLLLAAGRGEPNPAHLRGAACAAAWQRVHCVAAAPAAQDAAAAGPDLRRCRQPTCPPPLPPLPSSSPAGQADPSAPLPSTNLSSPPKPCSSRTQPLAMSLRRRGSSTAGLALHHHRTNSLQPRNPKLTSPPSPFSLPLPPPPCPALPPARLPNHPPLTFSPPGPAGEERRERWRARPRAVHELGTHVCFSFSSLAPPLAHRTQPTNPPPPTDKPRRSRTDCSARCLGGGGSGGSARPL